MCVNVVQFCLYRPCCHFNLDGFIHIVYQACFGSQNKNINFNSTSISGFLIVNHDLMKKLSLNFAFLVLGLLMFTRKVTSSVFTSYQMFCHFCQYQNQQLALFHLNLLEGVCIPELILSLKIAYADSKMEVETRGSVNNTIVMMLLIVFYIIVASIASIILVKKPSLSMHP